MGFYIVIYFVTRLVGAAFILHLMRALYYISPYHPLFSFPGPRLAALTYYHEAIYDLWYKGGYTKAIKQMHEKYGPIIRINPHELHCSDPEFSDSIYGGERDK